MQYLKSSQRFLSVCFLAVTVSSCTDGDPKDESTYNRLCRIYEDVGSLAIEREQKRVRIFDRVYEELPALSELYFSGILNAERDRRYDFLQRVVKVHTGNPDWKCQSFQSFYANG
ncbi:hypothetical protein DES49_2686 [Halospina denitrificans]|uniref:Uncharacterized protein n=1 Tax=Halospina denitrificans TaxID=332522 RepID=A0A4R7JKW3_9GAMM|nr:hypothetical protein DES49_2686 [Halospina denitrificans]